MRENRQLRRQHQGSLVLVLIWLIKMHLISLQILSLVVLCVVVTAQVRLAGECAMLCNDLRTEVLTLAMCR